jgi:hypothetical protein
MVSRCKKFNLTEQATAARRIFIGIMEIRLALLDLTVPSKSDQSRTNIE